MTLSPIAAARRTDRLFAAAIAANAIAAGAASLLASRPTVATAVVVVAVIAVAVTALAIERLWGGSGLSAHLLSVLLATTGLAMGYAQPETVLLVLDLMIVLGLVPMYRRWPLVVGIGVPLTVLAAILSPALRAGAWPLASAFLLVQTALQAALARRNEEQFKELFDINFLVRAMGRSGPIRLDLQVLRAESALGQRMRDVQQRVAMTLHQVQAAVAAATTAARDLQQSGRELSERTEHSGRELSAAAMTLSQIAVIVKSSADAAMAARQTAQAASALVHESAATVNQMVAQMHAIAAASRRIADVTGVIESIAFQTNMLALNAAVEAARAGEQGRGFAVVAGEVRMLAKRATMASLEIKALIDESTRAVVTGSQLAGEAGRTMTELTSSVGKVDEVFHSLSADTNEHAAGLVAIRDTMNEMNEATQRNLELAARARAIADELAGSAGGLREAMRSFRLGDAGKDVTPPVSAAVTAEPVTTAASPRRARPAADKPAAVSASAEDSVSVEFF
jgi:methyl-accepting chemotaxis protein